MALSPPKIAIITDWITDLGGQARVDLALHEAFPDAPIFTSVYEPDRLARTHFENLDIRTTWLQKMPRFLRKFHRLIPMLRVKAFRDLDLSEFDIIISSSSAESKQIRKTRADQIHICYCHTPIRYYWSHQKQYMRDPGFGLLNWPARIGLWIMLPWLKKTDYDAAQNIDIFIANSSEVQKRIKKYYKKTSSVIHPPVDIERFMPCAKSVNERRNYLAHGRQVPYKRIDLAIRACNALKLPLVVSGNGPDHEKLQKLAGPTVEFRSNLSDSQVAELFGSSKGFIFPAEEDFGIVQVEALAAGTPVIAFASGGSEDVVKNGEGGIIFSNQSVSSLQNALLEAERTVFQPNKLQQISKRFAKVLFITKLRKIVNDQAR